MRNNRGLPNAEGHVKRHLPKLTSLRITNRRSQKRGDAPVGKEGPPKGVKVPPVQGSTKREGEGTPVGKEDPPKEFKLLPVHGCASSKEAMAIEDMEKTIRKEWDKYSAIMGILEDPHRVPMTRQMTATLIPEAYELEDKPLNTNFSGLGFASDLAARESSLQCCASCYSRRVTYQDLCSRKHIESVEVKWYKDKVALKETQRYYIECEYGIALSFDMGYSQRRWTVTYTESVRKGETAGKAAGTARAVRQPVRRELDPKETMKGTATASKKPSVQRESLPRKTASSKAKAIEDIEKHIDRNWKEYSRGLGWKSGGERERNDRLSLLLVSEDDYPEWKKSLPHYIVV